MSQIGIGAMLHFLSGGSEESASNFYGKTILSATMEDDAIKIDFDDGTKIKILDDGQSCCERRYMKTDDNLSLLIGGKLVGIEIKPADNEADEWGEHEVCFLEISTDKAFVSVSNHNEHNGYYGGFGLTICRV